MAPGRRGNPVEPIAGCWPVSVLSSLEEDPVRAFPASSDDGTSTSAVIPPVPERLGQVGALFLQCGKAGAIVSAVEVGRGSAFGLLAGVKDFQSENGKAIQHHSRGL